MIYKAIINKLKSNYLLMFLILIGLVWLTTCTFAHLEGYAEQPLDTEISTQPQSPVAMHHQRSIGQKKADLLKKVNQIKN